VKELFLTIISLVLVIFSGVAQNPSAVDFQHKGKNMVKVTPVTLAKSQLFMFHYERVLSKHLTFAMGVAPIIRPPLFNGFANDKFNTGVAIDPEIRWYEESAKIMEGFFFGFYSSNRLSSWESQVDFFAIPFGSSLDFEDGDPLYVTNRKVIIGIQMGKVRLIGSHFIIEYYYGLGVYKENTIAKDAGKVIVFEERNNEGLNLRFNLSIGWRF